MLAYYAVAALTLLVLVLLAYQVGRLHGFNEGLDHAREQSSRARLRLVANAHSPKEIA
jgi:hypothetical protein